MSATAAPAPDVCPRCGRSFACGAAGPGLCPCTTVTLSVGLQAQLRARFHGCLCLDCLRELAAQDVPVALAVVDAPSPPRRR